MTYAEIPREDKDRILRKFWSDNPEIDREPVGRRLFELHILALYEKERAEEELAETEADNFSLREDFERACSEATIARAQVDAAIEDVGDSVPLSEGWIPTTVEERRLMKHATNLHLQLATLRKQIRKLETKR